eukprot:s953_g17.t1
MASVSFEDISLELPSGDTILSGVSGEFRAGRMCAIMGPSGAGKTSLMNVLCGKASYATVSGVVRFNGQEGDFDDYKTVMGFVPQEDVVHEGLTVGEQIRFSADLRNASDTDVKTRKLITEDVLKVMQLDGIQNSIVGGLEHRGISGGQRKRVSIGLELAADPTMLFLDEPTSGLDAASSLAIVHSLKRMTQLGVTSVMVVHQPRYSLFSLFDDVLLLGKGGRTVYFGPPSSAKVYFQRLGFEMPPAENPADWFMDLVSGEVPNHKIPQFVPEMLFDIWELNKDRVESKSREVEQAMLEMDEWEELLDRLDEEWPRISYQKAPSAMDPLREGVMREEDLFRFLKANLLEEDEEDDNVREAIRMLLKRIGGEAASVATKTEVLEFLASLQGVVASDKGLQRPKAKKRKKVKKPPSPQLSRTSASPRTSVSPRDALRTEERSERPRIVVGGRRLPTMILEEEDNAPKDSLVPEQQKRVSREAAHGAVCGPLSQSPSGECCQPEEGEEVVEMELVVESHFTQEEEGDDQRIVNSSASVMTFATSASKVRRPSEFLIVLEGAGELEVDFDQECDRLIVKRVGFGGRVEAWNNANPGLKLKKGDHVVKVNEVYGSAEELLSELERADLHLLVQPRKHTRPARRAHSQLHQEDNGSLTLLRQHSGSKDVRFDGIPRLNLQKAPHQAPVAGPRGLHASLGEELKAVNSLSPSRAGYWRRKSKESDGEGSSCSCSSSGYSSVAGEAPRKALLRSIEEATLRKLSPRTRSVWSRRLVDPDSAKEDTTTKRVALNDDASCSEITMQSDDKMVIEWEASEHHARQEGKKASLRQTKSFTSAQNLRKYASNSKPPGFFRQLAMLLHRGCIQWWRQSLQRSIFLFIISGSSAILGLMDTFVVKEQEWQILPFLNLHTTLALLTAVFCLNVFSADRPVFWRERESGLNVAAFFASKIFINAFDVLLQCFLLAAIYYMIRQPVISFELYFLPFLLAAFAASGLGYAISTTFPVVHGPFIVAIVIFVVCGLLGHPLRVETMADGGVLELIMDILSISRWSVAYYWKNYSRNLDESSFQSDPATWQAIQGIEQIYEKPQLVSKTICGLEAEFFFLVAMGVVWTVVSYLTLSLGGHHRHKKARPWKQRLHRAASIANRFGLWSWAEREAPASQMHRDHLGKHETGLP